MEKLHFQMAEYNTQSRDKLREKLNNQRKTLITYIDLISKLRDKIESLKAENDKLKNEIESLINQKNSLQMASYLNRPEERKSFRKR